MLKMDSIIIRQEQQEDYAAVEAMTREAFWNHHVPGCNEHYLAHVLRVHPDFIPQLDLVAERNGQIVGNITYPSVSSITSAPNFFISFITESTSSFFVISS